MFYFRFRRLAHSPDDGSAKDDKRRVARRTLQLASLDHRRIEGGDPLPFVPPFRGLTMVLQAFDGDLEQSRSYYQGREEIGSDEEHRLFEQRARCAWSWIERYAPDDFRFRIRSAPVERALEGEPRQVIGRLVRILEENPKIDEAGLIAHLKTLCHGTSLEPRTFFPYAYDLLIGRPKGPKLTTLIHTMGVARALPLLRAGIGEVRNS